MLSATQIFPATAAAGALLTPAAWLADKLYKRYEGSGRTDRRLLEGFITFRSMSQRVTTSQ